MYNDLTAFSPVLLHLSHTLMSNCNTVLIDYALQNFPDSELWNSISFSGLEKRQFNFLNKKNTVFVDSQPWMYCIELPSPETVQWTHGFIAVIRNSDAMAIPASISEPPVGDHPTFDTVFSKHLYRRYPFAPITTADWESRHRGSVPGSAPGLWGDVGQVPHLPVPFFSQLSNGGEATLFC